MEMRTLGAFDVGMGHVRFQLEEIKRLAIGNETNPVKAPQKVWGRANVANLLQTHGR